MGVSEDCTIWVGSFHFPRVMSAWPRVISVSPPTQARKPDHSFWFLGPCWQHSFVAEKESPDPHHCPQQAGEFPWSFRNLLSA